MTGLLSPLFRLDRRATLAVRDFHAPARDRLVKRISFFGSQRFMIPATFTAVAALFAVGQGRLAAWFGAAVLGGRALSPLMKWTFRRTRPNLWPALETEKSHSFPSTHSTMGAVFFGGLCAVVFRLAPHPFWRGGALLFCALAIGAIAFSRVYLGAHWLSDVAGGVALGLCWLLFWAFACHTVLPRSPEREGLGSARARLLLPGPAGRRQKGRTADGQPSRFSSLPRRLAES